MKKHLKVNENFINYSSREDIEEFGEAISKYLKYNPENENLEEILEILNIKIKRNYNLDNEISFILNKDDNHIINLTDSSLLKNNYQIVHEIGHLYMHTSTYNFDEFCEDKEKIKEYFPNKELNQLNGIYFNRFLKEDIERLEWEANWFASSFLMPKDKFLEIYDRYNGDLDLLGAFFSVTKKAVKVRMERLEKELEELKEDNLHFS